VGRALRSIFQQSHLPHEVIVVDDGSTDGTVEAVRDAFREAQSSGFPPDVPLRLVQHETNQGVSAARNTGVAHAVGAWVAFLDSDDEWRRDKLKHQARVIASAAPSLGVIYGIYPSVTDAGDRVTTAPHQECASGDVYPALLRQNVVGSPSAAVVRVTLFREIGGFDPALPACEDWDVWIRCAERSEFRCIGEPLIVYHDSMDTERISRSPSAMRVGLERLLEKHAAAIREAGAEGAIWNRLGKLCMEQGDPSAARRYLLRAARHDPTRWRWVRMALASLGGRPLFRAAQHVNRLISHWLHSPNDAARTATSTSSRTATRTATSDPHTESR
jgi:glycosyltransferase involved in cell wall biosynthesis